MSVIDAEGRLFGRVNLVDAAIGAFVVFLVPLAIGAVLLFRPPTPVITSVEPAQLTMTEDRAAQLSVLAGKVKVRGTGLRPVLRANIGGQPAIAFIFEDPSTADVLFGDLPAGSHDLVLYDGVQEVARARAAVTIPEKPVSSRTRVRAVGPFLDMPLTSAQALKPGAKFPDQPEPAIEIVALGELVPARYAVNGMSEVTVPDRWQRSGVMAVRCQMALMEPRECRTGGTLLSPGQVLAVSGSAGGLRMSIELVLPDADPTPAEVRVRFLGYPSVLDLLRTGDRDREHWAIDGRGAVVTSLGERRPTTGAISIGLAQEGLNISAEIQATEQLVSLDAVLRLGLDESRSGWRYRNDVVRVGSPITFTTREYVVRGIVLSLNRLGPRANATTGAGQ